MTGNAIEARTVIVCRSAGVIVADIGVGGGGGGGRRGGRRGSDEEGLDEGTDGVDDVAKNFGRVLFHVVAFDKGLEEQGLDAQLMKDLDSQGALPGGFVAVEEFDQEREKNLAFGDE